MDFIRFRDRLYGTSQMARTIFFNDAITWLETEEYTKVGPEQLQKYQALVSHLKKATNMIQIEDAWYREFQYTYGGLGCMEKLFRRLK